MHLALWLVAEAAANNYDVGNGQTYATIGAAVAQATQDAGDGHVIRVFDVGPYAESVVISEAMEIRGEGVVPLLQPTEVDAGFFTVDAPGAVVKISSFEIDGQGQNRAILLLAGLLELTDAQVHDTVSPTDPGGAILVNADPESRLTVTRSTFTNSRCLQVEDGGAIATLGGDVIVLESTFEGGQVGDDGAHIAILVDSGGDLLLEDSVLRDGVAEDGGGSVYLRSGNAIIRRSVFENNAALLEGGGAFQAEAVSSLLVEDVSFVGNSSFGGGGAVYQIDGSATYTRSIFCNNHSDASGGAFFLDADSATIENSVFLGNDADVDAGAIKIDGTLAFSHNSLAGNSAGAEGRGHALFSQSVPGATITDSWFGYHPSGTEAVFSIPEDGTTIAWSGWWSNAGGSWNNRVIDLGDHTMADSLIPEPPAGTCDALLLVPPIGSPLRGAASDGSDMGAFGGPNTWPDADEDGFLSLSDCDDADPDTWPGADEIAADGVDQDCDRGDLCYIDTDDDGFGNPDRLVSSEDLACDGPGEASNGDEACEGFDDALDQDGDGIPDGCDGPNGGNETPGACDEAPALCEPGEGGPKADGAGCGCATGSPAGLPLLLGIVALVRRRRR